MNFYDLTFRTRNGELKSMSDFKGRAILIVNTATQCGFTNQYAPLQKLYEKYGSRGLAVLDFPCNQFLNQAPESEDEIHAFCTGRFGVTFDQNEKIEVLGENIHPIFRYLTEHTSFSGFKGPFKEKLEQVVSAMDKDFKNSSSIKWNFTKFLISKNGEIIRRFEPTDDIEDIDRAIAQELN